MVWQRGESTDSVRGWGVIEGEEASTVPTFVELLVLLSSLEKKRSIWTRSDIVKL